VVKALGRFYSTRAYMALLLKMRFFSAALAYSGNTLVAKWKRQNRNFMARLKALPTGSMILPP
jgi:hypothetical protein